MAIILSFSFFVVLMIVVGQVSLRRKGLRTAEDYLMAGRSHGKFTIALSAAASATSGFIMLGAVGAGYTMGLLAVLMPLGWFLGDLLFWTLFPDRINAMARDRQCATVPEFISQSMSRRPALVIRRYVALIAVVFVALYAVAQYLAAGKAVNAVFDLSLTHSIIISGLVIAAYSVKGGLASSIPTQFVQALIMLFTTFGLFALAVYLGGGPVHIVADIRAIDPELLALDGGRSVLMLALFLAGFAAAAFSFDFGQPHLLVRIMATRSPEEAASARWTYLAFMQVTWISMSLFGLIMVVLLPEIGDPEQALPIFARENLHPILAGAVMAGIFAAVASTLDAQILVLSSSIGVDLFPSFFRRMTQKMGVRYQMMVTLLVALVTGILAINLVDSTTVFNMIVFSANTLGAAIGCAMFINVLGWRTSPWAMAVGMSAALVVTVGWRMAGLSDLMMEAFPGFVSGLLVHWVVLTARRRRN